MGEVNKYNNASEKTATTRASVCNKKLQTERSTFFFFLVLEVSYAEYIAGLD